MRDSWFLILQGEFERAESMVDSSIIGEMEAVQSSIAEKQGDYRTALVLALEARSKGHPFAPILEAYAHWRAGRYDEAEASCRLAVHHTPAKSYNLLALIEWTRGKRDQDPQRYHTAIKYLSRSRELWNDQIGVSYFYNNSGNVLLSLGKSKLAELHYFHALTLRRQTKTHALVGTTLRDLGRLYKNVGRPQLARSYLLQSLKLRRRLDNASDTAKTLLSLIEVDNSEEFKEELVSLYGRVKELFMKRMIQSFL